MKTIIVDDEPKAIDLIMNYLIHFPQIEIQSTFRNALKALDFLKKNPIDLIFVDINMPHFNGLSFTKLLDPHVKIIFTTAYAEYAHESYEVDAVDYLLKPISFERFAKAIHRASKNKTSIPTVVDKEEIINLRSDGNIYRVLAAHIYFLEKAANYMTYHTTGKRLLVRQTAAEALKDLPTFFIQVHKSYIINCRKVDYFNKEEISINSTTIPLGNTFRDSFLQYMQTGNL